MPGREQEQWLDRLGASGIRRDVLQQKSDETVLLECHNLDPVRVAGAIRKVPGQPAISINTWYTHTGFYPPILTTGFYRVNNVDYAHGVGHISPDIDNGMHFYFQQAGTGNLDNPVGQFECETWDLIAPPIYFMDRAVTPRGDQVPAVISEHVDITVALETDLSHDGAVHREAKTGFPFIGFIQGAAGSRRWYPPFASYVGTTSAHGTYMTSSGWGLVGSAYNATDGNVGGPDAVSPANGFLEFDILPAAGQPWLYGYANYGDDNAVGWGVKFVGTDHSRYYLRKAAVGYVYVYADGTTSEMFVMHWENAFGAGAASAKTYVPVNMTVNYLAAGPASVDTNFCVIAWKLRCRLPKDILLDHSIVGVRVFYSHWSSVEGDTAPYDWTADSAYQGWTSENTIFANMREVMYLDPSDAKAGYCMLESADMTAITEGATSFEMVHFQDVLCPFEPAVAQINEISSGALNIIVEKPMVLGRLWSEIRGENYTETGVVADVGGDTYGVGIKIFENGRMIRSYSYSDATAGDMVHPEAPYLTEEVPTYAPMSHGCVAQAGRVFHWGVAIPGAAGTMNPTGRKTVWDTLYPTHIDQDGVSWPTVVRYDLGVPIRMGEIRAAASIGRDLIVGTTLGIALVSFGSGLTNEWSVRVLDQDVGVGSPTAILTVGSESYIAATNGTVYRYRDGAAGLDAITGGLYDPDDPQLPKFVGPGESYPTDFVYNRVAIANAGSDGRIVICFSYNWYHVKTLIYAPESGVFTTASRFFLAASRVSGDVPYVTTGNSILKLWDHAADFYETIPDTSYSTVTTLSGQIGASPEIIDDLNVVDTGLYNLAGGSAAWEDKSNVMVGFSQTRIREALMGVPPGGALFYRSNGWINVGTYTADFGALGTHGHVEADDQLYDTGGKYSVTPDLWYLVKVATVFDILDSKVPWKLSFEKFITSPGRRQILSMFMLKGTIQDTFTIKFYADGSATAHTTLTVTGGFSKYKQIRTRVPAKHSIKIVMEATTAQVDVDGVFDLQRVGFMFREGGRLGQGA